MPANLLRVLVRKELGLDGPGARRGHHHGLLCSLVAALAWLPSPGEASAQPPFRQELVPGLSSFDADAYSTPDLADLDGDGDFDVVFVGYANLVRYLENTGGAMAPAFVDRTGAANPFRAWTLGDGLGPELVDLDGDGDLDAVAGSRAGSFHFFENSGSSREPAFVQRTGPANPFDGFAGGTFTNPDLVDLDGDGDLDACVGGFSGPLRFLRNTGTSTAPAFVELSGPENPVASIIVGFIAAADFADLDGDGDRDAHLGDIYGRLRFFENTGTSAAAQFAERTGEANPLSGFLPGGGLQDPKMVDLDGDGDLDGVFGNGSGTLRFLTNTGTSSSPAFIERTGTGSPFGGVRLGFDGYERTSAPALVDLDGDGDLDVVSGEDLSTLVYLENTGDASSPAYVERSGSANPFDEVRTQGHGHPAFADLDGDGDLDGAVGESSGTLHYLHNAGSPTMPVFIDVTSTGPFVGIDTGSESRPEFADLDADGRIDLAVGNGSAGLRYFRNDGSPGAPLFAERTGPNNPFEGLGDVYGTSPELVDFDGDGDFDAVLGDRAGRLSYFENTGTAAGPAFAERTGASNPFSGIDVGYYAVQELADLDGDGDLDVLTGESGGILVFWSSGLMLFADGFESGDTSAWSATVP